MKNFVKNRFEIAMFTKYTPKYSPKPHESNGMTYGIFQVFACELLAKMCAGTRCPIYRTLGVKKGLSVMLLLKRGRFLLSS